MAMTPLERKRKSLERKAEAARKAGDPTDEITSRRFFEYIADVSGQWKSGVANLEIAGLTVPVFDDDSDDEWSSEIYDEPFRGSIGRAERMVGLLIDAAVDFAATIKAYKREAIEAAIAQIEQADLAEHAEKKKALAEVVRLAKLRDQLERNVRWEIPQWQVTRV